MVFHLSHGDFSVNEEFDRSCFTVRGERDENGAQSVLNFKVEKDPESDNYNVEIQKVSKHQNRDSAIRTLGEFTVQKTTEKSTLISDNAIKFNCNSSEDLLLAVLRGGSPNHMALTKAVRFALIEENVEFLVERPVGEVVIYFSPWANQIEEKTLALPKTYASYLFSAKARDFMNREREFDFIISAFNEGGSIRVELTSYHKGFGVDVETEPLVCTFDSKSLSSVYRKYAEKNRLTNRDEFGDTVLSHFMQLGGLLFDKEDVINFLISRVKNSFSMKGESSFNTLKSLKVYGNFDSEEFSTEVFDISLNEDGTIENVSSRHIAGGASF